MIRSAAILVAIMVVAGWPAAGTPFRGDQVVYVLTAKRMADGAVLYRDVWDVTNPGVFWFYQLAGTCFGFTEDGIHLFEWLYWLAFVFTVSYAIKRNDGLATLPICPAFFIAGVYYFNATSDPNHLTRAEGLVGFPLFVSIWLACRASTDRELTIRWALLAGIAGGAAILFKWAFGLCVVAAWLAPLVFSIRYRNFFRMVVGLSIGLVLVLGAAAASFALRGGWHEMIETLFVLPREILSVAEQAEPSRLANSIRRFVEVYSPVLAAAVGGGVVALKRRGDPVVVSLILVMVASFAVILIQRWSWWDYHFLLLGIPASIIAAWTWPTICLGVRERFGRALTTNERFVAVLVGIALFLPVFGHGANAHTRLASHRFGITAENRTEARNGAGRAYAIAMSETNWLAEPGELPGPIFVAGDPCFHWVSGRPSASRFNGWSLELFPPRLWGKLMMELKVEPPIYIFIAHTDEISYAKLIRERAPELSTWIDEAYRESKRSTHGVWYRRN